MRHHQNGCSHGFIDALNGGKQHLGRMAVQCAGGFVRQNQLGIVDDGSGAGAPLLLAAGYLIGVFFQNIRDV